MSTESIAPPDAMPTVRKIADSLTWQWNHSVNSVKRHSFVRRETARKVVPYGTGHDRSTTTVV